MHHFYFYTVGIIRNIKFYQLQAIRPIYYWKYFTLTKIDCLVSEMSIDQSSSEVPTTVSILQLTNSMTYWWNSMTFHNHSHFP